MKQLGNKSLDRLTGEIIESQQCGCCKDMVDGVSAEQDEHGDGFCECCFNIMIQLGHIEHGPCCHCGNLTTWVKGDKVQSNTCNDCWEAIIADIVRVNSERTPERKCEY